MSKRPPKAEILRQFYKRDEWEGLRSKPGVTVKDTARKEPWEK